MINVPVVAGGVRKSSVTAVRTVLITDENKESKICALKRSYCSAHLHSAVPLLCFIRMTFGCFDLSRSVSETPSLDPGMFHVRCVVHKVAMGKVCRPENFGGPLLVSSH